MDKQKLKKISKRLSYVLRHHPDSMGLQLQEGGWIAVEDLLNAFQKAGSPLHIELLEEVVTENDKQRFEFSADKSQIRARQGHSVDIDLGYEPATPPDLLYHGTATRFLESIFQQGLIKAQRHHVHLSTNKETMRAVGQRHGKPVILSVDAKQMLEDGHQFFITGNSVWLTDHVPPQYLTQLDD